MRMPRINPKQFGIALLVCTALGVLLSWLSGMPLWLGILIIVGALLVNGLVAEVEDRAPGGFHDQRERDD
jgi:hypothetical protein